MNETDHRFYTAPSTLAGAGEGLFAAVPLERGDRLHVIGVSIDRDSIADRCTSFADQYKLRVGDDRLLIPFGWGAKVNHHHEPNLQKVIDGGRVYLEALRPIATNEEVFFRYHEYATSRFDVVAASVSHQPG